jgi:hypothetical protein
VTESVAFVLCIENNEMRDQALLLIESVRAFAGAHRTAEIWAVAPRPGLGVDRDTRARLIALSAPYVEEPINRICPEYGSANRVYAAAWVARHAAVDTLIVLDSDALMLDEPELLGPDADVAVRRVDKKGTASEGPGDVFEPYWQAMCDLAGCSIDLLPFISSTIDRRRIRASYSGGYSLVRRTTGILERTAEIFTTSVEADLRPRKGWPGAHTFASAGHVSTRASEFWGSNQTAFAIAAWSTTRRVRVLDARYNEPLHALGRARELADWAGIKPIHVHYHWMLYPEHRHRALEMLSELGVPPDKCEWIAGRTPLAGT